MFTTTDDVLDVTLGRQPLCTSNATAQLIKYLEMNRKRTTQPARPATKPSAARAPAPAPKPAQPAAPPRRTAPPTSTATNAAKPPIVRRVPATPPPRPTQAAAPARPAPAPQPEPVETRDEALRATWAASASLRSEFSDNYELFVAYLNGKAAGRVQLPQQQRHQYVDRDGAK